MNKLIEEIEIPRLKFFILRCTKCHKLLGKYLGAAEIICPRCKIVNYNNGEKTIAYERKVL